MSDRVAVIIPAYNAAQTLADTLTALARQVGGVPSETIVVDNGSTDDTMEIARRAGAQVLSESRRGPAAARNRGLFATDAGIIVHLDSDTVPSRRWLSAIVAPFEDSACMLVAGNTQCYPPRTAAERYVAQSGLYDTPRAIGREVFPFAPSLNMAVRREAAARIGGWNVEMLTGEDVDFSHRLITALATRIVYAPDAILYHRTRTDRASLVRQARSYGAGAAHLYRRYPSELRWDRRKAFSLWKQMSGRMLARGSTRILAALGRTDAGSIEFADYHWLWTSNFWRGFFEAAA